MTVNCWDPLCTLEINEEVHGPMDECLQNIDSAFSRVAEAIDRSESSYNSHLEDLIASINYLYSSRANEYSMLGLSQSWATLIYHTSRLLFERLSCREVRAKKCMTLSTADQLVRADLFDRTGIFQSMIPEDAIRELRLRLHSQLQVLKMNFRLGKTSREELSTNNISIDVVHYLNQIFSDLDLLVPVSASAGGSVCVSGFALEISVPYAHWWSSKIPSGQSRASTAAYFHRDETCFVPKAIVYLSDVDDYSGPFAICPSSYRQEKSEVCRAASRVATFAYQSGHQRLDEKQISLFHEHLPEHLNISSHYGFDLPDSSAQAKAIAEDELRITGKAGTCIVFDGYDLLHRGGLSVGLPRLALQVMLPVSNPQLGSWLHNLKRLELPI
jgi:hypothetical protein